MSRDLIKFSTEHKISKEEWHRSWTPKKYFRFNNDELEELFTKDPHIEFEYGEAALLFFEQGIRPSSTQPASQGFPYFVSFFKSSTGRIKGIVEFIPANNKDDGLSGKTADDKDFEYKGKKYGVKTDQPLSGSTGLIHRLGLQQLAMLNPELYSDDKGEFDRSIPQMAGGIFLGKQTSCRNSELILEMSMKIIFRLINYFYYVTVIIPKLKPLTLIGGMPGLYLQPFRIPSWNFC